MTNHDHERALDLIMRRGPEDIAAPDADWLESHLAACSQCAEYANDFDNTGQLLRTVAVTASPSLVAADTATRARSRAVFAGTAIAHGADCDLVLPRRPVVGTSAWLWWKFGGWVVERFGLPVFLLSRAFCFSCCCRRWLLPR